MHQVHKPRLGSLEHGLSVASQECIEVEVEQLPHAFPKARGIVHHATDAHQRPYLLSQLQLIVERRSLGAGVGGICRVDRRWSFGNQAHPIGRAYMIAIGEQNARHTLAGELIKDRSPDSAGSMQRLPQGARAHSKMT